MINMIRILVIIFLVFTAICIFFCIEAYVRYKRKIGIDEDKDYHQKYQYFGQTIYDKSNHPTGYELLLREYSAQDNKWQLPYGVENFPLNRAAEAIEAQAKLFDNSIKMLAINMTVSQLLDYRSENFLNWVQGIVPDKLIVVELDARDVLQSNWWKKRRLIQILKILDRKYTDIEISIEGVDSSTFCYKKIDMFLPLISDIKFDAAAFNKSENHWIDVTLGQWKQKLKKYDLNIVLGKVETQNQDDLAKQLKIDYRQGYLYQKPTQIE
ncbi:EAL domain-containing protein [Lactobacillus kalixensis]|uniref:EAL domain-containing protein n=1 Tax=Lactobacillus kalixensis TaxID=227944 RepID=UPI0007111A22|nr:EAL domain-containing protein [Lactobacillus kalixensis]